MLEKRYDMTAYVHRGYLSRLIFSNTDLGDQQLNIEKRDPQCACDGCNQNDNHPRNRIVVSIGVECVGIPIDLIPPLFWEELQCPGVHNEKYIEQGKRKAEK